MLESQTAPQTPRHYSITPPLSAASQLPPNCRLSGILLELLQIQLNFRETKSLQRLRFQFPYFQFQFSIIAFALFIAVVALPVVHASLPFACGYLLVTFASSCEV